MVGREGEMVERADEGGVLSEHPGFVNTLEPFGFEGGICLRVLKWWGC